MAGDATYAPAPRLEPVTAYRPAAADARAVPGAAGAGSACAWRVAARLADADAELGLRGDAGGDRPRARARVGRGEGDVEADIPDDGR